MRNCWLLQSTRTKFFFDTIKKPKTNSNSLSPTFSVNSITIYHFVLLHPSQNEPHFIAYIIESSAYSSWRLNIRNENKKNSRTQLQKVLSEFDFLHDLDHPQLQQQAYQQPRPAPAPTPSTPPILQQRPQIVFSGDVYHRPVMSMPPVILMGGPVCDGGNSNYMHSSMPSSPIVEMPPSPAPSSMMYVDFPADEIDEVNIVQNIVEVRVESIFSFFCFSCFYCAFSRLFLFSRFSFSNSHLFSFNQV